MSEIENISLLISNFGFPIVITLYLLVRFEKKFDELEAVIRNLAEVISKKGQMKMSEEEIIEIIQLVQPKLKKVLNQTEYQSQDDLEQDLMEKIIIKIKNNHFMDVPGFFEFIEEYNNKDKEL